MRKLKASWTVAVTLATVPGVVLYPALAQEATTDKNEPPLFRYTPPVAAGAAAPVTGTVSIPPANSSATTPPSNPPPPTFAPGPTIGTTTNVLILALDEADINAARISNILQLLPGNLQKPEKPKREKPGEDAVPTPAQPPDRPAAPEGAPVEAPINPALPFLAPPPEPEEPQAEQPELELPAAPQPGERAMPVVPGGIVPAALQWSTPPHKAFWMASAAETPARAVAPAASTPAASTPAFISPPSSASSQETISEEPGRRPPGRAQLIAAPLRRAIYAAGFRDVLMTPLDSATIVRSINSGRLPLRTVDALRFTTGQLLEAAKKGALAQDTSATPETATSSELAQTRQIAIAAASRIGLSLGYRAVIVLAVTRDEFAATPASLYSLLLVDAPYETGQAFLLRKEGAREAEIDAAAAGSAASNITSELQRWAPFSNVERATQVEKYLASAREALQNNQIAFAQDQLNLVVSFDPSNSEAYVLMGDALQADDPVAAARAYQRAAEIDTKSGEVWSKIAIVHTLSNPPDWIRSLQAANRSQQLGYDSANLRTAMAAAEFGRAELFRRSARIEQAEDAELVARRHLERARELAPDNPEVSAGISRLMAKYLLDQKRYKEAVQSLDLLAIQYPDDLQTQTMYARALEGYGQRDEDTFLAWARVWRLTGESRVPLDATRYAVLADGFDQRLVNIARNVFQLTYGFSTGAILRETAIVQTRRAREEFKKAMDGLLLIKPPPGKISSEAHVARLYAAELMQLAFEHYATYLETGDDINRNRALENHRLAIESLNLARGSSAAP